MIEIKKNISIFNILTNIIKNITIEINFEIRNDGVFIRFTHGSNIALGLLKLNKEFFDTYEIEKEQIIAIDSLLFFKIVKRLGKKSLQININENGNELEFLSGKSFIKLKTYTLPEDKRNIPTPEFTSIWNIKSEDFFNHITEHIEFGSVVNFKTEENTLKTIMKSNLVSGEVITEAKCILKNDVNCFYDLEYLSMIMDIKKIFDNIIFSFGKELPCRMYGENEELNFTWFLAPRIDDNE